MPMSEINEKSDYDIKVVDTELPSPVFLSFQSDLSCMAIFNTILRKQACCDVYQAESHSGSDSQMRQMSKAKLVGGHCEDRCNDD